MLREGNRSEGSSVLPEGLSLGRRGSRWARELRGSAIQPLLKLPQPTASLVSPEGFPMSAQRFGGQEKVPTLSYQDRRAGQALAGRALNLWPCIKLEVTLKEVFQEQQRDEN